MATLEINELHEPALFMGVRRESDEIAAMVGARRREDPSRILCDTSHGSNAEYARQSGDIAARSRSLINNAGWGDNLEVMREKIPDEIADLVYLDPPFSSSRSYNLLFRQVKGNSSPRVSAHPRDILGGSLSGGVSCRSGGSRKGLGGVSTPNPGGMAAPPSAP